MFIKFSSDRLIPALTFRSASEIWTSSAAVVGLFIALDSRKDYRRNNTFLATCHLSIRFVSSCAALRVDHFDPIPVAGKMARTKRVFD